MFVRMYVSLRRHLHASETFQLCVNQVCLFICMWVKSLCGGSTLLISSVSLQQMQRTNLCSIFPLQYDRSEKSLLSKHSV